MSCSTNVGTDLVWMPAGQARCWSLTTCGATSVGLTTHNTYAGRPDLFDDHDVELAEEVAAWVAIAVGNAEAAARTSEDLTQLRTMMMTRAFIEQAKGILIERHKIKEDEAFTILTQTSQRTNTKLRDVAAELVRTGMLPSRG